MCCAAHCGVVSRRVCIPHAFRQTFHLFPVYEYFCTFFIVSECSTMGPKKKYRNMIKFKKEVAEKNRKTALTLKKMAA